MENVYVFYLAQWLNRSGRWYDKMIRINYCFLSNWLKLIKGDNGKTWIKFFSHRYAENWIVFFSIEEIKKKKKFWYVYR